MESDLFEDTSARVPAGEIVMTKLRSYRRWQEAVQTGSNSSSIAAAGKIVTKMYSRLNLLLKLNDSGRCRFAVPRPV
jgi:hypothetical protein